jgi:XTP/dITP diphosphohydrolase
MNIIFATNNRHKIEEIMPVVPAGINIITLSDAGIDIDIPEPHDTLEENAREKAQTIFSLTGQNCFSEDTGLEVDALNGQPGVKSARYGGEERSFEKNISRLLKELQGKTNRNAKFRTVICLIFEGKEYLFEGICEGEITFEKTGTDGFGYDPVFTPAGTGKTFAQMNLNEKNLYSHRRKAVDKLVVFLNQPDLKL